MHGVGFLLDDRLDSSVESLTLIDEIIIGIDLKLEIGVRILNVYTPRQGIPAAEKSYSINQYKMAYSEQSTNRIL